MKELKQTSRMMVDTTYQWEGKDAGQMTRGFILAINEIRMNFGILPESATITIEDASAMVREMRMAGADLMGAPASLYQVSVVYAGAVPGQVTFHTQIGKPVVYPYPRD